MQFRKKPVVVEAVQWFKNGDAPDATTFPIDSDSEWVCKSCGNVASKHNNCPTLEGFHIVCPGDWIICGVNGEFYPCKPDIFAKTYEPAEAPRLQEAAEKAITDMDKAVKCLYLELPESVADDVKYKWEAVKNTDEFKKLYGMAM